MQAGRDCRTACQLGSDPSRIGDVKFDIVGEIEQTQTIAAGRGVRARFHLQKLYGQGRWRKLKGEATVRLPNGKIRRVELHWYEAHGIGRRDFKIKTYLDQP
jgi:hypothetical protein